MAHVPEATDGIDRSSLRAEARRVLERHWVAVGYTAPNSQIYPWQWLWDSCFHAVIWAELGDERAVTELTQALSNQDALGFVPHMNLQLDPGAMADLWGREGSSSITQPPMYGHAVAELQRRGLDVPEELVTKAMRGVEFLLERRARNRSGLVELVHPWESGTDDSPRWDDYCPGGFDLARWRVRKNALVHSVERDPATGSPLSNPRFAVASAGFNALVAFNAMELGMPTDGLVDALAERWDADRRTWVDDAVDEPASGGARTVDGLLPALVDPRAEVAQDLVDEDAYGGVAGPAGVHRQEPAFDVRTYWRGPAWPQLSYLLWLAMSRAGYDETATSIARSTAYGALRSGLAEYWDPDDGAGLGAVPQSWAGLAACMVG